MRQHVFYGALYHWFVMFRNGDYRNFRAHPDLPVTAEFALYLKRLLLMPFQAIERRIATTRIRLGGFPTIWRCCNWNTTARSRCTRPSKQ